MGSETVECSSTTLFDPSSSAALGDKARCSWEADHELVVEVGVGSSIRLTSFVFFMLASLGVNMVLFRSGDSVSFHPSNSIQSRAQGAILIANSFNIPSPTVPFNFQLKAPLLVSPCFPMVVSSIESFFLAGLSLRLQWSYIGPADPVVSDLLSVATMDSLV